MMARVRGVMARSMSLGSRFAVQGSISTNTGLAPQYVIASAVAMKVFGVVMTSSPCCTPSASNPRCKAAVPLLRATQCFAPQNSANSRSKASISSPWTKADFSQTRSSAGRISSRSPAYSALRSRKGTFTSSSRAKRKLYCTRGAFTSASGAASDVGESAGDFGAAESPGKDREREWYQDRGEKKEREKRWQQFAPSGGSQKSSTHTLERIGDRNEPRENLQRPRQNRDRVHHSSHQ